MGIPEAIGMTLEATDVTQQKMRRLSEVPPETTVGEMIAKLLGAMNLPPNDVEGRPLSYRAHHEREGRHLRSSEQVGDALQNGDRIVLQPDIDAGL